MKTLRPRQCKLESGRRVARWAGKLHSILVPSFFLSAQEITPSLWAELIHCRVKQADCIAKVFSIIHNTELFNNMALLGLGFGGLPIDKITGKIFKKQSPNC